MVNDDVAWSHYDALQSLVVQVARMHPGWRPADPIGELLERLYDAAISSERNRPEVAPILEDVRWGSPGDAGAAVGFTDRRVQQLCAEGKVRARRHGQRSWLVDIDDLHRYLRDRAS